MSNIRTQIWNLVWSRVCNQLWTIFDDDDKNHPYKRVDDLIRYKIKDHLQDKIENYNQIYDQIKNQLEHVYE